MTDTTTTRSPSKAQIAHGWIRERIHDGRFSPGFRLVLGQIGSELEMSVVPVREAVRLLEAEGLVTFEPNVGASVALVDKSEYLHTMQTLALVEGSATALSSPLLDADAIARARAVNDRMAQAARDVDPPLLTALNHEFHAVLFEPCPNPHILDLVHRGWERLARLRDSTFSFVPGRAEESVAEHAAILGLIEKGAPVLEIELAARNHRLATLDAVLAREGEPA